jgi:branched-chain amino acid transport system substrate-binding protein
MASMLRLAAAATAALALGVVSVIAGAGSALASEPVKPTPATGEPIVVGHFGSLTGSEATFGISTSRGIQLAIKEFNAGGGLNGRPIKLVEYDTRGDNKEAALVVDRLVNQDKVSAVLGEVASSRSMAGAPIAQKAGVPMISPSSTNPQVTAVGDMIFRVCFIDPFQGTACAKFARTELEAKTAAILFDQAQAYSTGLAEEFKKAFVKLGGKIVTEQVYQGGAQDFTAQLSNIKNLNADVVFIPGYYTDVGNIAVQARQLGVSAPLLGGDGWDSEQLAKIGRDAIRGSFYSNHYAPDQPDKVVKEFITRYREAYGGQTPDGLAALGYDAANLLFEAMKRSPDLSGKALAKAIAATKAFPGVTGTISIDEQRNARKPAVIVEMSGEPLGPKFVRRVDPD